MRRAEVWAVVAFGAAGAATAAEPGFRWRAPLVIERPAAFVELPLPVTTYAHSEQPGLADLRIVDAAGQRVPFAFLPPAPQPRPAGLATALYPLPRQRTAQGQWQSPVTVELRGGEVRVQSRGLRDDDRAAAGWLFDLGPHGPGTAAAAALEVRWSGPDSFTAPFELETSADLRHWSPAGSGQLMALTASTGPLTQPLIALPGDVQRFVRLLWREPAGAPQLTQAHQQAAAAQDAGLDPPTSITLAPLPAAGPLIFDLGGALTTSQVSLDAGPMAHVLPLRIDGRVTPQQPWQSLAQGVVVRFERDGQPVVSPPIALRAVVRYLRVRPDERAAPPSPEATRLTVQVHLPRVVFALQGQAPFTLQTGHAGVPAGALPATTLVPELEAERPRFGAAVLGAWQEDPAAAQAAEAARRRAAWRPWLLWGVLLAGVAGLGAMVLRLARRPAL